ncbi:MAG: hypothetical protein AAFV09_00485 [Pseudomonadota bacterium]
MDGAGSTPLRIALVGAHIGRSRFGMAQSLLADRAGITLSFDPFDSDLLPDLILADLVVRMREEGQTGLTVTHPFKTDAHRIADIRQYPEGVGASNLLRFGPEITAFNTDYSGFLGAWRERFADATPGTVAVAGAGGAARAVIAALLTLGADRILLWDTDPARAVSLAETSARIEAIPAASAMGAARSATGLVNATPLGMHAYPGSAFEMATIGAQGWAFDAVYTPINTPFVLRARAARLDVLTGFDLFRHMAVASFAIYANRAAPAGAAQDLLALSQGLD